MNLRDIHDNKAVSAKPISNGLESKVTAIQILSGEQLKEHISKTPALLICVIGEAEYGDEKGTVARLTPGDIQEIEPMLKHWVKAINDSQLILIK